MDSNSLDHYTDNSILIKPNQGMSQFPLIGYSTATPVGRGISTSVVDLETELFGLNKKYTCKKTEYKQ